VFCHVINFVARYDIALNYHIILTVHWLLAVTRKRLQLLHIYTLQLWAVETANNFTHCIQDAINCVKKNIRLSLRSKLVNEASEVVALCQRLQVEDAASEIGNVDAGEGVCCAGVTIHCQRDVMVMSDK
jgi:hypothetical protein